ncbi:MAG: DUF3080 family protein [Pseudomonadota bacterium]
MVFLLALGLLPGCAPDSPEGYWRDYAERIARTLEFEWVESPPAEVLAFPSRRALQQPVAPLSMSLLDFMRWRACDLQELIGQRNSAMGKVMPDSQQLLYEHRLMTAVSRCLDTESSLKPEAEAWLKEVLAHKRQQRTPIFWNGVLASPEMQAFFSPGPQRLSVEEAADSAGSMPRGLRAASSLIHWHEVFGKRGEVLKGEAWERRYRQLGERPVAYEILLAMEQSTRWLNAINQQMREALEARSMCPQGVMTPRGEVMQRILTRRYQGLMQPFLARVERWHGVLVEAFSPALGMDVGNLPESWHRYARRYLRGSEQGAHGEFRRAIVGHTEVWQSLLSSCGALPSRPGT